MSLRNPSDMRLDPERLRHVLSEPGTVLLDDARHGMSSMLFRHPTEVLRVTHASAVRDAFHALDRALERGKWIAGYLTYEAGAALHGIEPRDADGPLVWFGVYDSPLLAELDLPPDRGTGVVVLDIEPARAGYGAMFDAVKEHIREGDVYQINLTGRVRLEMADPVEAYLGLRQAQPVPYGAFIHADHEILSLSPERFFRREGRRITARPMKGTAPRGLATDQDITIGRALSLDPKNRAENLMIVDLLRNDLSIVCEPGSVQVPRLFEVERHPTLWQMTSDVEGTLREDVGLADVFEALFPCGSITGAPKRRAMSIIRTLEPWPRGVYCGAIGYASPDRRAEFNVAIRTIERSAVGAVMGTGSGLVWDSEMDAEYDELRLKTRFLAPVASASPDALIETFRFDGQNCVRLSRHLDRMIASAAYFGFDCRRQRLEESVSEALEGVDGPRRVRVELSRTGRVTVELSDIPEWANAPVRLAVTEVVVNSADALLYHKSDRRSRYDRALETARSMGADEGLLVNERGEITEGSFTNIFVEIGSRLVTPSLHCGLLPGVLRQEMLDHRRAIEGVIRLEDLRAAHRLYVGNSLRGLARADLVEIHDSVH